MTAGVSGRDKGQEWSAWAAGVRGKGLRVGKGRKSCEIRTMPEATESPGLCRCCCCVAGERRRGACERVGMGSQCFGWCNGRAAEQGLCGGRWVRAGAKVKSWWTRDASASAAARTGQDEGSAPAGSTWEPYTLLPDATACAADPARAGNEEGEHQQQQRQQQHGLAKGRSRACVRACVPRASCAPTCLNSFALAAVEPNTKRAKRACLICARRHALET